MTKIKLEITELLKEIDVSEEEIKHFFEFHKQGFEMKEFTEELEKMEKEELKKVIGGMLVVYQLNSKAKENDKNPLMGMLLFNMLNNLK